MSGIFTSKFTNTEILKILNFSGGNIIASIKDRFADIIILFSYAIKLNYSTVKKIKLNFINIQGNFLSREELKKIMGGDFGSDNGDDDTVCRSKIEEECLTAISCTFDCGELTSYANCKWSSLRQKCSCYGFCA